MKYLATIQGGSGPDVWDEELKISAVDFLDAATQATSKAERLGGYISSLEQWEWDYTASGNGEHLNKKNDNN